MRDQFPFAVARVTRRWRKMLDERLKDLGVTQARWSTMVYLSKGGEGLTQRELACLMAIENPTLVRLLDSLEQQGLIERRPCPDDRRARRLFLTQAGKEFMDDLSARAEKLREELLVGITDEEIENSVKVFEKIMDNAQKLK
ncbi:MAG: MarR family transcriptional regulator [Gammaproteobacteria bacterium]|uniref:Transcriptional regulator, MarR family n=1 Tax=Marinobacter nitratireducens TaxID=1137280 RepID=A0A072MWR7_9GAMM|nr:MarR family transcriptional regulator [Marinobacter nitratireducens]KEF29874.1 Transcriptional regulator, MarR family [Marinobacter nitratireducens]TNE75794.1 MAG: MarR family transcriptional regulator [Gammaproteobacteria bacterium]TNF00163.1 MAG: MarR family transcriptional regulator [Gammaproteobacteria bacterium]